MSHIFWSLVLLASLTGCATTTPSAPLVIDRGAHPNRGAHGDALAVAAGADPSPTRARADAHARVDAEGFARLWRERTSDEALQDYPLGPGDMLEISVPLMEELRSCTVRIANTGIIVLPLLGEIQTNGLSEKALTADLRRRLEAHYLNNAQVQVFLRESHSRQVAVVGAVAKPGVYTLSSGDQTLLDVISQAGGLTDEAAAHIQFVPAEVPHSQGGYVARALHRVPSNSAASLARTLATMEPLL